MKKLLSLFMLLMAVTIGARAGDVNATLDHTAGAQWGSNTGASTVDAEKEHYNSDAANAWAGCAYAKFTFSIPEGHSISKATLTYSVNQGGRSGRNDIIYYMKKDFDIDWTTFAGQTATDLRNTDSRDGKAVEAAATGGTGDRIGLSQDVTTAVKAIYEGGQNYIIFQWTGNAGGADLYGKGSENAPTLVITTTDEVLYEATFNANDGALSPTVTVYSDADRKTAVAKNTLLANTTYYFTATLTGYKDYNGDFAVETSNPTVNFTMTAKNVFNYTVNGVDGSDNPLGQVNSGSGFEGETITYYYPQFVLSGTTLYVKNKNGGNPYWGASGTLDANNKEFSVQYGDGTIENVVFYKEAEDIEGFTAKTTNNAPIRCSNGMGGVVAEETALTTLAPGKYKIYGQVWGTTGVTAGVKAGEKELWSLESTGSLVNSTSDEFEITESTDLTVYTTGGNDNHMLDLLYIVKTGEYVPPIPAGTYDLTLAEGSDAHGTVTFTVGGSEATKADKDDVVTVSVTPAEGFVVKSVTARAYTSWENAARATSRSITDAPEVLDNIDVVKQEDGTWKFIMPEANALVQVEYEAVYAINIATGIQNGTVEGPANAVANEKVTLTVTPAEGYELETLTITCAGTENEINYDVTDYSFTMPAQGVYVKATFKKKPIYIETDLTKDFISLTSPTTWKSENTSNVGQATWAAPQVTVAGSKYYMNENYVGTQALKETTGGVMYNEITGLTPGLYTIELYGSAAVTVRDDITATFTEGDEASLHAVTLYAESNGEKVSKYIPCLIETNFNNRGGEESIPRATLDNVVVGNDGKIKIGLYKEVGLTNWHIVQLKSVTAKVSASDLLAKAIADAQGVAESDVPAALYSEIQTAIETYDKEYATADEYLAAINALNALVDKANGYSPLAAVINEGAQYKANAPAESPAIAAYDAAIADVKAAYDAAVVADIPAAVKVVEAALPALAKAQTAPNSDMTRVIVNPTINGVSGWTCERPKGGGGPELPAGGAFEYWAGSANPRNEAQFDYYQVIEGLPSGKYIISAEMYNSLNDEAGAEFAATSGVYGASGNDETATLVDVEGTTLIRYATEPVFVKDGTLRLGVKNTVLPIAARWFVADNFTLTLVETIPTYEVDLDEPQNGAIEVSAAVAAEGDKVIITATPNEGYELESVSVKGVTSDIAVQVVTDETTGEMSFTMPKDDVTVTATFKGIAYPITYALGMQNGTVTGPASATADEKVTLTITPAEGYELETLTIRGEMSEDIINYDVVDYSFTMPKEGVYIIATFVQPTGIDAAPAAKGMKADGKYFKNGKLIIIKNGKEYSATGAAK